MTNIKKVNCNKIEISNENKICIIAGPCQLETEQHAMDMAGKIKEMEGKKFDRINIHTPKDTERKHGMSGTKMRMAASVNSKSSDEEFHKHLGKMFSKEEAMNVKNKINFAIQSGQVKLKRP